ncbi:WecB/TagA/CpsF family glycosyltransferase [Synechococcus sp. PCC 7336]|uniref:WecB/TagA/CpsF family glycosyltransferase n=1 Tax=Synechococcus sp. PCC 7336 TaxID=195250 RepID=UPI00057140BC|nr:WecB/TagA/CpsF family glycosyltransferase [Synechococcus sp. PCC 7336]
MLANNIFSARYILSTFVHATSYEDACDRISTWVSNQESCYVVAANVHVVMTAYWDANYREVIQQASLVTPDGMPLVWAMRLLGVRKQQRVYGPDLMLAWCARAESEKLSIYLYGGTETMLRQLQDTLRQRFPSLVIAGSHSPPFRPLAPEEEAEDIARIHASGAGVVFVGLGCPKQEEWMARQKGKLQAVAIGVGAAFSFHSGEVTQAPRWMMSWGLEWLFRLWAEPRRLWKRYLINNPAFAILFALQLLQQVWRPSNPSDPS